MFTVNYEHNKEKRVEADTCRKQKAHGLKQPLQKIRCCHRLCLAGESLHEKCSQEREMELWGTEHQVLCSTGALSEEKELFALVDATCAFRTEKKLGCCLRDVFVLKT